MICSFEQFPMLRVHTSRFIGSDGEERSIESTKIAADEMASSDWELIKGKYCTPDYAQYSQIL